MALSRMPLSDVALSQTSTRSESGGPEARAGKLRAASWLCADEIAPSAFQCTLPIVKSFYDQRIL
jgi:hypothetical protein